MKASFLLALLAVFSFLVGSSLAQQTFDLENEDHFALWWYGAVVNAGRLAGEAPTVTSRCLAILSTVLFEVANTYETAFTNLYTNNPLTDTDLNVDASIIEAGRYTLATLFPDQLDSFNYIYKTQVAVLRRPRNGLVSRNIQASIRFGRSIAIDVLEARLNDGSLEQNNTVFNPVQSLGLWRPTLPAFASALTPGWGTVSPFVVTSNQQFLPAAPPSVNDEEYLEDLDELLVKGRDNSYGPTKRSILETYTATFFSHEFVGEKSFPSLLFDAAADIAIDAGLDRVRATRLLALTGLAVADSLITTWNAKYLYNQWRPITALTTDSRGNRPYDPAWRPHLPTPAYPAYPSAHAAAGAAAATIWARAFGTDEHRFRVRSDTVPGLHPTYFRFSQFADDVAYGRVYAGVQYRHSADAGYTLGQNVANYVWDNVLRPAAPAA